MPDEGSTSTMGSNTDIRNACARSGPSSDWSFQNDGGWLGWLGWFGGGMRFFNVMYDSRSHVKESFKSRPPKGTNEFVTVHKGNSVVVERKGEGVSKTPD